MEVGDTLKELDMTADEMDRFTKAFKDEKFREMLRDYAQEISEPENRKRYEEEIKLLEQERGNNIKFIHPQPFRAIKTSVDGKRKCFINICASENVGKPESQSVVSKDGQRGQRWSLPHSLPPGRQDTDHKGNKIMIYDVIFHPDTLHIASKNKRFMDMVVDTAIQGIQDAFKVTLDKNNVRELRTKYKGTPQPCVIRKPIPGYKAKEQSEQPDPLAFPYPDEKRPATLPQTGPVESPPRKNSNDAKPKSFLIQPQKTKEPTKPKYTVKYRSVIDLQDFRCSRDSAQSPRPKEIVVTVDMPLLKSVTNTSLEVKEKSLLLESKVPAYRLELPLAYPVDEDKGEAKFNKQRGQLTITLPVLPPHSDFDYFAGPATSDCDFQSVSNDESQEEDSEVIGKKRQQDCVKEKEQDRQIEEQETILEEGEGEEKRGQEKGEEQMREGGKSEEKEGTDAEKEKWKKLERKGLESVQEGKGVVFQKSVAHKQINNKEFGQLTRQDEQNEDEELSKCDKSRDDRCDEAAEQKDSDVKDFQCISAEEENSVAVDTGAVASPDTEKQHILISAGHSCGIKESEEVNLTAGLDLTPQMKPPDIQEENVKTKETEQGNTQVGTDAAVLNHTTGEESKPSIAASLTPPQNNVEDCCISESKAPVADEATKSSREDTEQQSTLCSEEVVADSVKQEEDLDTDDLPTEQIFQTSEFNNKPPPVLLREIDKDGSEAVISDHSTSAGFIFQNTLLFELD